MSYNYLHNRKKNVSVKIHKDKRVEVFPYIIFGEKIAFQNAMALEKVQKEVEDHNESCHCDDCETFFSLSEEELAVILHNERVDRLEPVKIFDPEVDSIVPPQIAVKGLEDWELDNYAPCLTHNEQYIPLLLAIDALF